MKARCSDPNSPQWEDYGGRGIRHCSSWEHFSNFANDMWPRPEGLQLDRKDNEQGYSKENCHWVTQAQNNQNKRVYKTNQFGVGGVKQEKSGAVSCRYAKDGVRYNLGRFNTVADAAAFKEEFKSALENDPSKAKEMLVRRARLDSQTGIKGITKGNCGYIVRKTVDGERLYLGHSVDFDGALELLMRAA